MKIRSLISKYRTSVVTASIAAVGLAIFVAVWFQPQKIFIEKTVKEAAPIPSTPTAPGEGTSSVFELAAGPFRGLEHRTVGTARLLILPDGSALLRVEGLDTSNGPDLRVYLSQIPPDRGSHDYGERFVDLGALKGNRGDQNYAIPRSVDVSKFRSAVIWCRRFTLGFGVAPLARA
jgi:electron transfer DM13